jgi:hypothetical protein
MRRPDGPKIEAAKRSTPFTNAAISYAWPLIVT